MYFQRNPNLRFVLALFTGLALSSCDDQGAEVPDTGIFTDEDAPSTMDPDATTMERDTATTDRDDGVPDTGTTVVGTGIASRYPGDIDITSDPDVIFADDFEGHGSAADLQDLWFNAFGDLAITRDSANVLAGAQSLEMTLPQQDSEFSNGVQQTVSPELDVLYLRWYAKIDANFDIVGSSHNGGGISAHYFEGFNSTPGVPADGTNKFLIEYEAWRGEVADANPGSLNVYVYHPDQRSNYGDHFFPNGDVQPNTSIPGDFGPEFMPLPNVTPELGRWYAYEVMLKANTPGTRDGRITMWLDGAVVADFPNLRLRDVPNLTIDRFGISFHAGANTGAETHKWVDNVVVARSYVGPITP